MQPVDGLPCFIGQAEQRLNGLLPKRPICCAPVGPSWIKSGQINRPEAQGITMSAPTPHHDAPEADAVEKIVPLMPIVLPVAGGILIFLLAFIAVFMA